MASLWMRLLEIIKLLVLKAFSVWENEVLAIIDIVVALWLACLFVHIQLSISCVLILLFSRVLGLLSWRRNSLLNFLLAARYLILKLVLCCHVQVSLDRLKVLLIFACKVTHRWLTVHFKVWLSFFGAVRNLWGLVTTHRNAFNRYFPFVNDRSIHVKRVVFSMRLSNWIAPHDLDLVGLFS